MDCVADGFGETAQGAARGEAADEDAGVFGMPLHPDPVAQDRAAVKGEVGSTARTPTVFSVFRKEEIRESTRVLLPAPGAPVIR